jgi:hypothetical protein
VRSAPQDRKAEQPQTLLQLDGFSIGKTAARSSGKAVGARGHCRIAADVRPLLPSSHSLLHGEKVAIGVLASLFLSTVPDDERQRVFRFCRAVGLPTRLAQVKVDADDSNALETVAVRACRVGEIIHNEPYPVEAAMVVAALKAMDRYGARLDTFIQQGTA